MECNFFKHLLTKKDKGEITEIILQPHVQLIPKYEKYGRKIRAMIYTPDFLVYYPDGTHVYIDVKGMSTQASDIRRKLFDYYYPDDTLLWITASKKYGIDGWLNYDKLKEIRRKNRGDSSSKTKG